MKKTKVNTEFMDYDISAAGLIISGFVHDLTYKLI